MVTCPVMTWLAVGDVMQMPGRGQGGGGTGVGVGVSVAGRGVGRGRVGMRVLVGVGVRATAVGGSSTSLVGVGSFSGGRVWDGTTANLSRVSRASSATEVTSIVRARFSRVVANSLSRVKSVSARFLCAALNSYRLNSKSRRPAA